MGRHLFAAVALAAATVSFASPSLAQAWQTYSNADLGVSVETPAAPAISTHPVASPMGEVQSLNAAVDLGDRGVLLLSVADYAPLIAGRAFDVEAGLDGSVNGEAANIGGVIDSQSKITVEGEPGREVVIHTDAMAVRSRAIIHHNRIYMLIGVGPKAAGVPREFDRFERSLHFTD